MKTVMLLSLLLMTFAVPLLAARDRRPVRALRGMALYFAVFITLYYLYVAFIHTRFFVPQR